jgi:transposase
MKNPVVEPEREAVYWLGVDVAKARFDAALVRPGQHYPATPLRELPAECFERSERGVSVLLHWVSNQLAGVRRAQVRVVMEATGKYSMVLAQWIRTQCPMLAPAIVNPRLTADFIRSLGLRNATDRLAARALALYGIERSPEAYTPAPPEYLELQSLNRYRDALVRERVAEMNRAEDRSASPLVNMLHQQRLRQTDRAVQRIEDEMKALVRRHPALAHDVALLSSIYGVAFLTASLVLAELGDLRRFQHARQLTAFAGLTPQVIESGTSVHKRPRLCKQGNARVRQALYLAAMVAIRGDNDLRRTYQRLMENGKTAMAALGAIMRKLLTLMRALLISGKPYDPFWKNQARNHVPITQRA